MGQIVKSPTTFQKGHIANPTGRPKRETEIKYLDIMISKCTEEDWADITIRAVKDAKKGNSAARKFLADYLIGTPVLRQHIIDEDTMPQVDARQIHLDLSGLSVDQLETLIKRLKE